MVQMNKYNAINSIKNNCLAEPHEAPGKGLTEANKEKDQNKRDIKKGGGGGGGGGGGKHHLCSRGSMLSGRANPPYLIWVRRYLIRRLKNN